VIQKKGRYTMSMERKESRDKMRDSSLVDSNSITSITRTFSTSSLVVEVAEVASSTSSSISDSMAKLINRLNIKKKTYSRTLMSLNSTLIRYSSSTGEERSGQFCSTRLMTRKARTLRISTES
jgi:hypothetical protein